MSKVPSGAYNCVDFGLLRKKLCKCTVVKIIFLQISGSNNKGFRKTRKTELKIPNIFSIVLRPLENL